MKVRSRSLKAIILASGTLFSKLAGLLSAIFLARYLTKADYSTYRQALLAYGTAAPFFALGLPKALYYFLPGEKKRPGGVFLENFLLLSVMGLLFTVGLWLGGADFLAWRFNNPDLSTALVVFAPFAFFMLPQGTFTACMMGRDRVQHVAIFQPLSKLVMVAVVITVAVLWAGSMGAIVGAGLGAALIYVPTVWLMFHVCRGGSWKVSCTGIKKQLHYSIPLGVAAMVSTTAGNIDKLLVSSMGTPEQFAVYVNGAVQLPLVGIITGTVVSVLLPDMAKHYKAGEYAEAIAIWRRGAVKCGLILIPSGIFLAGVGQDFMAVLFGERYRESGIPFAFYAMLLPLSSVSFGSPLLAAGKTKLALFECLGSLAINFGLTVLAIKLFGIYGAAAATLVTTYCWAACFNTLFIKKYYHANLRQMFAYRELSIIAGASLLASASFLLLLIPLDSSLLRLSLCGFSFFLVIALVYWRVGFVRPEQVRDFYLNKIKKGQSK
ncbi:oligosaccharide flippase family protein [Akkermansiaceae bacterium]|nr:oligosaccharide flippase family protein [Akkermansiaceae bacterium]